MTYAATTKVSPEKSEAELKQTLRRAGANRVVIATDDVVGRILVSFEIDQRVVRIEVPLPLALETEKLIKKDAPRGWYAWPEKRKREFIERHRDQEERQRFRALLLIVKAKLEIISIGLSTVEREFLADLVLPGNTTVMQQVAPKIRTAYETGVATPLLGA